MRCGQRYGPGIDVPTDLWSVLQCHGRVTNTSCLICTKAPVIVYSATHLAVLVFVCTHTLCGKGKSNMGTHRHARVRTANPEVLWRLRVGQAREELRVLGLHCRTPLPAGPRH